MKSGVARMAKKGRSTVWCRCPNLDSRFTSRLPSWSRWSDNAEYKQFLDGLLAVFTKAKRAAADQRLKETGRAARVAELFDEVCELCFARCGNESCQPKPDDEADHDYHNLVHEVARLACDEELFTFVLHPKADATNNEAERSLRGAAQDRRTGRTSKTLRGAQRRTILMSVLESLKLHLAEFTLESVLTEVQSWWHRGESLFDRLVTECGLDPPTDSRLDKLVPLPKTA